MTYNINSPYSVPKTKYYRKIDRTAKSRKPEKSKILDEDIDDFISNLSCDTSDMSDDSDFEFDATVMNQIVDSCKPELLVDLSNFEKVYDIVVKQGLPPYARYPAKQLKNFVIWCNLLCRANLKLCRAVYFHTSLFMAWIIHVLFLLSTSYKSILLSLYRVIVRIDSWTDRVLDDRTVAKKSPIMSDTVREQIAESMELSKTPINPKRARELLRPAASTMKNEPVPGPGQFWQWIHGIGEGAVYVGKTAVDHLEKRLDKSSHNLR